MRKVLLSGGAIGASVSDSGVLDWQRIVERTPPTNASPVAPAHQPEAAAPWRIRMQGIEVKNVSLDYSDPTRRPALAVHTAALNGGLDLDVTTGGARE